MLLSYPSLIAIVHYRIAHVLYIGGSRIVARSIAEVAHRETGIDIHPGATIGPGYSSITAPASSSERPP